MPLPAEIDKVVVEPDIEEVARVLVRYEPPAHSVRLNITMDEALLKRVDAVAERQGFTRSGFLASAVRRCLAEDAHGYEIANGRKGDRSAKAGRDVRTGAFMAVGSRAGKGRHVVATVPKSKKRK